MEGESEGDGGEGRNKGNRRFRGRDGSGGESSKGGDCDSGEEILNLRWNVGEAKWLESNSLVGQLMLEKHINQNVAMAMIMKGWNLNEELSILEVKVNTFVFSFVNLDDYNKVLKGRPWTILGCLLNIRKLSSIRVLHEIDFSLAPFWVQFHDLPLGGLCMENVMRIGSSVGEVVVLENPIVNGKIIRNFAIARVLVDVRKPLKAGFWVARPGLLKVWISMKDPNGVVLKDGKPLYGAWLYTAPNKVWEEAVVVFKDGWRLEEVWEEGVAREYSGKDEAHGRSKVSDDWGSDHSNVRRNRSGKGNVRFNEFDDVDKVGKRDAPCVQPSKGI
ncbi:TMV resistance protein N-like [Senna tora]|uniref:TMV resistance protein N-like n=1 Tax=Senna tora TaxID=362788 RepID=A0A834WER0_9FABA|nr:TMV resistance protein N-like [Senna tora]